MPKFISEHTFPPGGFTREQVCKISEASQQDPVVRGYRSFINLTEGKAFCILEAPNKAAVADWFKKMGMPYGNITEVELEGERGVIKK